MKQIGWSVRFQWKSGRGNCYGGADTGFPPGTSILEIIQEVATWRNVNLNECTEVEVTQTGAEWDDGK
jgi:hypothetical protein